MGEKAKQRNKERSHFAFCEKNANSALNLKPVMK